KPVWRPSARPATGCAPAAGIDRGAGLCGARCRRRLAISHLRSPCLAGQIRAERELMRTVIGLFDTIPEALYALKALELRKYDRSDISVIVDDLSQLHRAPANIIGVAAGSAFN